MLRSAAASHTARNRSSNRPSCGSLQITSTPRAPSLGLPVPMASDDQVGPLVYSAPPVCKEPDELGQPWRVKLVLLDMLGFVVFALVGFQESKRIVLTAVAGD
jgi:hypothetical protein